MRKTEIDGAEGIGKLIRRLRVSKGYSQSQLGELVGATQQSVAHWEEGRNIPNEERLALVQEVLGFKLKIQVIAYIKE